MYNINFSRRAVEDLSNIWNYTAKKWSLEQADNYYNMLISFCKEIAKNPFLYGKKYDDVKDGLLGRKVERHIIFYHIREDKILILRILHERMDYYKKTQW